MPGQGITWSLLSRVVAEAQVTGCLLTGAVIVAICREHAVDTVLSSDRDFARFPHITWQLLRG